MPDTPAQRRTAAVVGAGFLGGALARALSLCDELAAAYTRTRPFLGPDGELDDALRDADTIFWLASSIRPATANVDDIADDRAALTSLLDALDRSATKPSRLIVASSGGTVYDPANPTPHHEDGPLRPVNLYGEAMVAIEDLVRSRAVEPCIVRVSNPYGPGQVAKSGQGVIAYWFEAIRRNEPITVIGSDQAARDYVFIDDVVEAMVRAHRSPAPPAVVNVGSGTPTTLADLVDNVRRALAPHPVKVDYAPARSFDAPSTWLDVDRARVELGWNATCSLEDGLRATWDYLTARDHLGE